MMENKKKLRKAAPSSSSDSESSSSSSSEETRRKQKHRNLRKQQRESSSSSEEEALRKSHKHQSHKKSSARKHSHSAKIRAKLIQGSAKKTARSMSPASRTAHKHHLKAKMAAKKAKLAQMEDHERRSRTPTRRDVKKDRTPEHRIASPNTRIRVSVPNNRVIRERSAGRGIKDSPSTSRRHIREPAGDKERAEILARCQERQRERERMKRLQEDEERGFKHTLPRPADRARMLPGSHISHITPDKHRHDRSHSRGKIPIRDRLDKDYEYRRSISREHEDYPMMRSGGVPPSRDLLSSSYSRERPAPRDEPERNFDYRSDDRRPGHDFGQPSRAYEERHHRPQNWEGERDIEPRSSRMYEAREWDSAGHAKRIPDEPYKEQRDRLWNDQPREKWSKEKDSKEWNRNWKEPSGSILHGPPSSSAPTMSHPRRWPGPNQSDSWTPRGPHPSSHKIDHSPATGSSFKPRFGPGGSAPHFGFKRFPFKRFPNQYSKINYPSRRVIPSGGPSSLPLSSSQGSPLIRTPLKTSDNSIDSPMKSDIDQLPSTPRSNPDVTESGEITTEHEEDKVEADTTFGGNVETQSQEECEGNLSEFSDVDDEILNRDEKVEDAPLRKIASSSSSHATLRQSNAHELARGAVAELNASTDEQHGDQHALKIISKIHANKELKKEMDLDFEEISDGELEEESRIKGLGDPLGVDWASLAKETQRPIKNDAIDFLNSTKSRFTPHRILWDIGVSAKLVGEDFARQVLTEARNELRREKQELRSKMEQMKFEERELTNGDVKEETTDIVKIKPEPKDEEENEVKQESVIDEKMEEPEAELSEDDFELDNDVLSHPLAQVQVLMRKLHKKRKNLILLTGKYGRALSARRDLKIRRQLCNLPTRDIKIDRSEITNPEINKHVDAIYRRMIGEVI